MFIIFKILEIVNIVLTPYQVNSSRNWQISYLFEFKRKKLHNLQFLIPKVTYKLWASTYFNSIGNSSNGIQNCYYAFFGPSLLIELPLSSP